MTKYLTYGGLPYLSRLELNDEMAFGIYRAARLYGVSIPEDISIIGFDNVPFADVMQVPLTTIGVPVIEMGKKLGEILIFLKH